MINQNRIYNWKINYRENGIGKIADRKICSFL
jgi:hypothetical protein